MEITLKVPASPFLLDSPKGVIRKLKLYAAIGMYQAGELSIGAACEFAEIDLYSFHEFLSEKGIPSQTQTPEELRAEFEAFR